ncbi:hypothetical protein [Sphingomonas sp. Leaf257]|jgi:hypothetical protein|uniref:hypothetical protein n=1 Tax=Sphingomonas sp. Leaf257 TaxID=1736309 RepID=UPI0006F2C631|nr:hypothetical protein [Sphingomonas sp. Leaf257]KQO51415.1 hypothetical protein ASF14_07915 [Sphingomonas sp. Leaf257]
MPSPFEQAGTVAVTRGSRTVTGTGTAWLAGYDGLVLNIAGAVFPVASVDGPSSLTLVEPYPGVTAAQLSYFLLPIMNENYALSRKVLSLIAATETLAGSAVVNPPQGDRGPQGVGVANAYVDQATGHLMQRLTDGRLIDAGQVVGAVGAPFTIPIECYADDEIVRVDEEAGWMMAPAAMMLSAVSLSVRKPDQSPAGTLGIQADLKVSGASILSAPLRVLPGQRSSRAAGTAQPTITRALVGLDSLMTLAVQAEGKDAEGLRLVLQGTWA